MLKITLTAKQPKLLLPFLELPLELLKVLILFFHKLDPARAVPERAVAAARSLSTMEVPAGCWTFDSPCAIGVVIIFWSWALYISIVKGIGILYLLKHRHLGGA